MSASASSNALHAAIRRLAGGESLTADETADAFDVVMQGEATPAQVAALLVGLRVKGETAAEVAGGARALRRAMITMPARDPGQLVDTCGTGGGKVTTFNISTAAAFVAAGAGARVAKHGNRSFTSRCGSADVLEALGVRIDVSVEQMAATLESAGIVFMFAPLMHPAMRHVGPVRREIAIPTVMNILGPLANPAGAGRQVIGVADANRAPLLAEALAELGSTRALVVHGEPGLDEVSPMGVTRLIEVGEGRTSEWTIDPRDFGYGGATAEDLAGGDPADNARIIVEILRGERHGGARAAAVLNAAAAIYVAGLASDYGDAVSIGERSIDNGAAWSALERLRSATAVSM
ncbi:MAG: anthranilate phosphoribosyltransferase [Gemmatimonadota bacterium]|nr:anthranilate phosphoribosyltransferase [Gemmatimonadota bacterium]